MLRPLIPIFLYSIYIAIMGLCGTSLEAMTELIFGALIASFLLFIAAWCFDKRHKIEACNMETASKRRKLWKICKFFTSLAWIVEITFVIKSLV